jgi:hypothetical protein
MQKKEFVGLWIPAHVVNDTRLSNLDMLLYAEIACYEVCYKKNSQYAHRFKRHVRTIQKSLSKLRKLGYIEDMAHKGRRLSRRALRDRPKSDLKKEVSEKGGKNATLSNTPPFKKTRGGKNATPGVAKTPPPYLLENNIENKKKKKKKKKKKNPSRGGKQSLQNKEDNIGKKINEVINLFNEVNPNYKDLFENNTQRSAMQKLIERFGFKLMKRTVASLPELIYNKYCPTITTPLQLKNKLAELIAFQKKQTAPDNKHKVGVA